MTTILDIHTHRLDATGAVISVEPGDFDPQPGRLYSVGIHPWSPIPQSLEPLTSALAHPQVAAVDETGLDALRGAPLGQQQALLERHIVLARQLGKPVVAHMVRTSQQLVTTWRKMDTQGIALIVHGMRGNANVARTLVNAGCYLSYGERFNPDALLATPLDRILAETDESPVSIHDIVATMAHTLALDPEHLTDIIADNVRRALNLQSPNNGR